MRFHSEIKAGKLELLNTNKFKQFVAKQSDGLMIMDLVKVKKIRSIKENRYYWGVVVKVLANELGYFPEEMHNALKVQFLSFKDKSGLTMLKSTANLDTQTFESYLRNIRLWASAELNINIPLPESESAFNLAEKRTTW